jgi:hypothetical protein
MVMTKLFMLVCVVSICGRSFGASPLLPEDQKATIASKEEELRRLKEAAVKDLKRDLLVARNKLEDAKKADQRRSTSETQKAVDVAESNLRNLEQEEAELLREARDEALEDVEKRDFSLLTLYDGKGNWTTGAGFIGDFAQVGRAAWNGYGLAGSRGRFDGSIDLNLNYVMYVSGVIGFTADGEDNSVNAGFGLGLRHVLFDGKLSILTGQYVEFLDGKSERNWLFGIGMKF